MMADLKVLQAACCIALHMTSLVPNGCSLNVTPVAQYTTKVTTARRTMPLKPTYVRVINLSVSFGRNCLFVVPVHKPASRMHLIA